MEQKLFDAINQSAKIIAAEKMIDQQIVFQALEEAMIRAAKAQFDIEHDVIVKINKETSSILFYELLQVIDDQGESLSSNITLSEAKKLDKQITAGSVLQKLLPEIKFTRNLIQMIRNIINQRVKEAENIRQYQEYKNEKDRLVQGIVKRYENGNLVVDIGRAEAVMSRRDILPKETLNINDKIKAYIYNVKENKHGPQIFISRTHPGFVIKLLEQEIPEITSGDIVIMNIVRDPGSKTKIAVKTNKENINPVGTCVGIRGSRINPIISELRGEKVDIIKWSDDLAMLIINTLSPVEIIKIIIHEQSNQVNVVVSQKSLSMAIGSGGQNIRLASQLIGKKLNIINEEQAQEMQKQEMQKTIDLLMESLQVDDIIAQVLYLDGFNNPEDILQVNLIELQQIQGINDKMAQYIQTQAKQFIETKKRNLEKRIQELNIDPQLLKLQNITTDIAIKLGEHGINNMQSLADLSQDELISEEYGLLKHSHINAKAVGEMIMQARDYLQRNAANTVDNNETKNNPDTKLADQSNQTTILPKDQTIISVPKDNKY